MKNTTRKIVISSMFAALICVGTLIIRIPAPIAGYIHLGDCFVLLTGWLLPPAYGCLAAGIGSALADVLGGYASYALPTFLIKAIMALVAHFGYQLFSRKRAGIIPKVISGFSGEVVMVGGYFLYEAILYGIASSALNVPANAVQACIGIVLAPLLFHIFEKNNVIGKIR